MDYIIIIEKNANGWYTGQCEQIPEAISEGATLEELKENMADAIKMVLGYKMTVKSICKQLDIPQCKIN